MYCLVRLGSIENRMDNQANICVQGEEECALLGSTSYIISFQAVTVHIPTPRD